MAVGPLRAATRTVFPVFSRAAEEEAVSGSEELSAGAGDSGAELSSWEEEGGTDVPEEAGVPPQAPRARIMDSARIRANNFFMGINLLP